MCRYYNEGEITIIPIRIVASIYREWIRGTLDNGCVDTGAVIATQKFST